jgi:energy-coupling factor transporter ATP-binding protein EcfA2
MRITRLQTTDGHLAEIPLELAGGLNCIIGARGTCKSTIVETIRFLYDDDPGRIKELKTPAVESGGPSHRGLLHATLKGGTAQIVLDGAPGGDEGATIERDLSSEPRVYVDGVRVVEDPKLLSEIEIYSQGELQEIATSPRKSLALVDRPHKAEIDEWRDEISQISSRVAEIGPRLRELRETVEVSEVTLKEGEPLREKLKTSKAGRPAMSPEMSVLREAFQRGERLKELATELLKAYRESVENLGQEAERMAEIAGRAGELRGAGISGFEEIAASLAEGAATVKSIPGELGDASTLEASLKSAEQELEKSSESYYEALREEEAITDALKLEDRLGEETKKLDLVEGELEANRKRISELEAERESMRSQLRDLRSRIYALRLEEVERINSEFADDIVLSLRQGTRTDRYKEELEELLEGSRLRERPKLCAELAASFPPEALISVVEGEDSTTLAETLSRDAGQMIRMVSHLADSDELFALESAVPDDELELTMYIDEKPRSVAEMSKGQKATAILPLLLRPASYPLILDQPEDDLDNRFIYKTLVEKIKSLKAERQLIFVTHNANIPVIGDADRVFAMAMKSPEEAELLGVGNVDEMRDHVIDLLEGGRDAFELRSQTYGLGET